MHYKPNFFSNIISQLSAGGPDHLRPHHPKDLIQMARDEDSARLHHFVPYCRVPDAVPPLFFGASFDALEKKSGGARPIADGCTL